MKGKKPVGIILDAQPGTSKTRELDTMALIKRDKLRDPKLLTDRYELRPLIDPESTAATTDLIKTTPERIRRSWELEPLPDDPKPEPGSYLNGLKDPHGFLLGLPETIEDDIPPVSQAFADKVKAMGGIMTPVGLICDPTVPVVGKRYMRLARALFCTMFSNTTRHVEDAEFHIRGYANRNRAKVDWEGTNAYFAKCLKLAFEHRHKPGRDPVYANKD
jgi:hypothetical protein